MAEEVQRTRRWHVLEKWQFEEATISTWAQMEATSFPLRVLLGLGMTFDEIVQMRGSAGLLSLYLEDKFYNFHMEREVPAVREQQTVEANPVCEKQSAAVAVDENENGTEVVKRKQTKNTQVL